jgi:hypothetical protein
MYQSVALALIVYCRNTSFFHVQCIYTWSIITQEATCPISVFMSTLGHRQHKSNFTFLTFTDIHLKTYQHYVHAGLGTPLHTATLLTTHFHCTLPPVKQISILCKDVRFPGYYSHCAVSGTAMTFQCQTDSCTAWNMSNNVHHNTHFYLVMLCYKKMV